MMVSTEDPTGKNPAALFENEKNRKISILQGVPGDLLRQLTLAADQFIVRRNVLAMPDPAHRRYGFKNRHCRISLVYGLGPGYDDIFAGPLLSNRTI